MPIQDLLPETLTFCKIEETSKKRVFEKISGALSSYGAFEAEEVFTALLNRERLGSTGIGDGVAIPHCRLPGNKSAFAILLTLKEPVDFDAIDKRPVDLICCLLVPEEATTEHLQILAKLAEVFSQAEIRESLRHCESDKALFEQFMTYVS